jgi:hypothetical protein
MNEDIFDIGDLGFDDDQQKKEEIQKQDENPEKQKFINDNIIAKGYNLEDLSRSITVRTGLTINEISLDTLKKEVEFYKTQQLKESYKVAKEMKAGKSKKDDVITDLYGPEKFTLKTARNPESDLTKLESEKKRINPVITDSKQETKGGLLGKKTIYTFTISTPEIKTEVTRTLEDFEFFHDVLVERYPFKIVPPIFPRNKDKTYSHELYKRYLTKFLNNVAQRKIFRTSPITLEFLELNTPQFEIYRKKLEANKFVCKYNMENYMTVKGALEFDFSPEQVTVPEALYKKLEATSSIYSNLNITMGKIVNDLNNLGRHMRYASEAFSALSNYSRESQQDATLVACYEKLKGIFNTWSQSYDKQKYFINQNFREFFDYLNLEIKNLTFVNQQFVRIKTDYEKYGYELLQKKEKLFGGTKYSQWELSDDDMKNIEYLKKNKEIAFKAMLPGMTNLVTAQKVQLASACFILKKEYERFMKKQGERVKDYLLSLKDKNQEIISDAYALCSLFNIEI